MTKPKAEPYTTEIGGEELLVTPGLPKGKERDEVFEADLDSAESPHTVGTTIAEERIPDAGAREWQRITRPTGTSFYKGKRALGETRMCANDRCDNLVSESKNPGVDKIFCERACGMRYHQRHYAARQRGQLAGTLELGEGSKQIRFNRVRPRDHEAALRRYKSHLEPGMCPNATDDTRERCPSHMLQDYYSERRLCLIYAVLVEDMKEQFALKRGELYYRQWTTGDGRWQEAALEDPDVGRHLTLQAEKTRRIEQLLSQIGQSELDQLRESAD